LEVVVNRESFLKYSYLFFEGKIPDCKTLETMIGKLSEQTSGTKRKLIVLLDAAIANDNNIRMLRSKGYDYLRVSKSSLKVYYADIES